MKGLNHSNLCNAYSFNFIPYILALLFQHLYLLGTCHLEHTIPSIGQPSHLMYNLYDQGAPSVTLYAIIIEETAIYRFTDIQIHPVLIPYLRMHYAWNVISQTLTHTSAPAPASLPVFSPLSSSSQSTVLIPPIPAFLILMFLLTSLTLQMYRVSWKYSAGCRRSKRGS